MPNPTQVMVQRVVAAVIDGVLFSAAWIGLFFALAHKTPAPFTSSGAQVHVTSGNDTWYVTEGRFWLLQAGALAVGFAYYALLPSLTGWTLGKLLLGIRIVNPEGRRAGFGQNLIRWLLLIVDDFPYFIPGVVGFILALTSTGHRRLGDRAADTYVVARNAVGRPVSIPGTAPAAGMAPSAPTAGAPPASPLGVGMAPASPAPAPASPATVPASPATAPASPAAEPAGPGPAALAPAGWYSDPYGQARLRWWDGTRWTDHSSA